MDQTELVERLYSLLPRGWFPDLEDSPDLNGILSMLGAAYSNNQDGLYQFLQYAQQQTRVATATDFWLDLIAQDYFGSLISRHTHESDASFRRRIILNLLAPKGTRQALVANIGNLTGILPKIIELRNTNDCGAYSSISAPAWGGAVYNELGAYGTMVMPFQLLIDVTRPFGEGIPLVNGYSMSGGGYATYPQPFGYIGSLRPPADTYGLGEYVELSDIVGMVTDEDIYSTISRTMPAGTTAWTSIVSPFVEQPPTGGGAMLDGNFFLDLSVLADNTVKTIPAGRLLGVHTISILAHGSIEFADFIGRVHFPAIAARGTMATVQPTTWSGVWTLPAIQSSGIIVARPAFITIPITVGATAIFTTQNQPILGTAGMILPFVLGTVPGAQAKLSTSFILGTSAPGEAGGVALISVQSIAQLGSLEESIPPQLFSVSTGAVAGSMQVSGVNVDVDSNALVGVESAANLGVIGAQGATLLPQNLPFQLGDTRVSPVLNLPMVGLESASQLGILSTAGRITGIASPATASDITPQLSGTQGWSTTRKTRTIALSGIDNVVATQTGNSQDPVYAAKTATSGQYYWELIVHTNSLNSITAGIGNALASATAGQFVGDNANSAGWQASNGALLVSNLAQTTWPQWTSTGTPTAPTETIGAITSTQVGVSWSTAQDTTTVCFALDISNGKLWGRIGNGSWNGINVQISGGIMTLGQTPIGSITAGPGGILLVGQTPLGTALAGSVTADPVAGTGGFAIPASILAAAISPAVTLATAGDSAIGVFLASSWQYPNPTGYNQW